MSIPVPFHRIMNEVLPQFFSRYTDKYAGPIGMLYAIEQILTTESVMTSMPYFNALTSKEGFNDVLGALQTELLKAPDPYSHVLQRSAFHRWKIRTDYSVGSLFWLCFLAHFACEPGSAQELNRVALRLITICRKNNPLDKLTMQSSCSGADLPFGFTDLIQDHARQIIAVLR